jgi:hypothetical protein
VLPPPLRALDGAAHPVRRSPRLDALFQRMTARASGR